jgi:soluble lytic murein transglycosylase-like protein
MSIRLHAVLMMRAAIAACLVASTGSWARAEDSPAKSSISVSREDGRVIFINDGAPRPTNEAPAVATPQRRLMYWSNTEHRYKPVPKAARSAAAEVNEYLADHSVPSVEPSASNTTYTPKQIEEAIDAAAKRHNVDPNLVRAVVKVESDFNPRAVSHKGAMGLMQLMPVTARQLNVKNPFDPQQNIDAGVRHLKQLLQDFGGNVPLSLAAYNAGAGAVRRQAGIPTYAETRNYVRRITRLYDSGNVQLTGSASGPRYSPVRVFRDSQGVLTFTNTD